MPFHAISFLLGVGVALAAPVLSRVLRPLAVEAAAAGMSLFQEGRRLLAEQMETLEDIVAEAQARRETVLAEGSDDNGHHPEAAGDEAAAEPEAAEPERAEVGPRRRGNGGRRRAS